MTLTSEGYQRPLLTELIEQNASDLRGRVSAQLDLSESTVVGNISAIFADRLSLAHEVLEEAVSMFDPDNALAARLVTLCKLTGTLRRDAQVGSVLVSCTLKSGSYAANQLVVHASGDANNLWHNREAVDVVFDSVKTVPFVSVIAGSEAVAAAGTLTQIASPIAGFSAATNPADATPGRDIEDYEDLRERRETEFALTGAATVDAIRARVQQVDGVITCLPEENTSGKLKAGVPAHSVRVVVWDGSPGAAADNDIAQAIYDSGVVGVGLAGDESGTAVRADGTTTTIAFERATAVTVYVTCTVVSAAGVAADDVKAAILAAMPDELDESVVYYRLLAAAFIAGVDDISSFKIGEAPAPSGESNISISATEIASLVVANITVSGDVS